MRADASSTPVFFLRWAHRHVLDNVWQRTLLNLTFTFAFMRAGYGVAAFVRVSFDNARVYCVMLARRGARCWRRGCTVCLPRSVSALRFADRRRA